MLIPGAKFNEGRDKLFFFYPVHLLPRTDPSLGPEHSVIGMEVRRAAIAYVNMMIAAFETRTRPGLPQLRAPQSNATLRARTISTGSSAFSARRNRSQS